MLVPVKQLVFANPFTFSSYCFPDKSSLKMYQTTPIATGFTLLFWTLNLPGLRNFSSIANPGSIKPFLCAYNLQGKSTALPHFKQKHHLCLVSYKVKVMYRFLAYRISFIGYLFIKWVKGKQIIIQKK